MNRRSASQIIRGKQAIDGAGVYLRRVVGIRNIQDFDPFLMLDGFDSENPDDYTKGFPWHPHRGIETITYLINGRVEHGDSLGNKGVINGLECQWMTAGSGIIHQEMPLASDRMLGCQIWLNLPESQKMIMPSYGDITKEKVVVFDEENAFIRIIAGNYKGIKGAFEGLYVKVNFLDVELKPNSKWAYSEASNQETLFIYLLDGNISVDDNFLEFESKSCAVLFESDNKDSEIKDSVILCSGGSGARFVLLSALPLRESVAWGGPIVMSTKEQLDKAFEELGNGTFLKHK